MVSVSNSIITVTYDNIYSILNFSNLRKLKLIDDILILLSYQHLFYRPLLRGLTLTKIYKVSLSVSRDIETEIAKSIKNNVLDSNRGWL